MRVKHFFLMFGRHIAINLFVIMEDYIKIICENYVTSCKIKFFRKKNFELMNFERKKNLFFLHTSVASDKQKA